MFCFRQSRKGGVPIHRTYRPPPKAGGAAVCEPGQRRSLIGLFVSLSRKVFDMKTDIAEKLKKLAGSPKAEPKPEPVKVATVTAPEWDIPVEDEEEDTQPEYEEEEVEDEDEAEVYDEHDIPEVPLPSSTVQVNNQEIDLDDLAERVVNLIFGHLQAWVMSR
jgi:hypothetical protein